MSHCLTITLNPAVDKKVPLSKYVSSVRRIPQTLVSAGGKGINVSRALMCLGVPTLATGIIAGTTGQQIAGLLGKERIPSDFLVAEGESRTNLTFEDKPTRNTLRIIGEGPMVDRGLLDRFEERLLSGLNGASVAAFCGKNAQGAPTDYLARLIRLAKKAGVTTVLDTSGTDLVEGLKAQPTIIKPNLSEAQEVLGAPLTSLKRINSAVKEFRRRGIEVVLISLGEEGAVGGFKDERWFCRAPRVKVRQELGCGDAFLAGYLAAVRQRNKFSDALRFATSCATINCQGKIPGQIDASRILSMMGRLRCERL
jgi:1-phosphofructokinase family hexose kinase